MTIMGERIIHAEFGTGTVIDVALEEDTGIVIFLVRFDKSYPELLHDGLEIYTGDLPVEQRQGRCWWCDATEFTRI